MAIRSLAPEKPKMLAVVCPTCGAPAATRDISGTGATLSPIYSGLACIHTRDSIASPHPRPFESSGVEFPKVVEITISALGIQAFSAEQPQIAVLVGPTGGIPPASRSAGGSRRTEGTVDSVHARSPECGKYAAPAHPGPFVLRGAEFPKVIEVAECAVYVISLAAEQPEISLAVGPCLRVVAASRNIAGREGSQLAAHSKRRSACWRCVASAHPSPFVGSGGLRGGGE